jgi:hypothetical protein
LITHVYSPLFVYLNFGAIVTAESQNAANHVLNVYAMFRLKIVLRLQIETSGAKIASPTNNKNPRTIIVFLDVFPIFLLIDLKALGDVLGATSYLCIT